VSRLHSAPRRDGAQDFACCYPDSPRHDWSESAGPDEVSPAEDVLEVPGAVEDEPGHLPRIVGVPANLVPATLVPALAALGFLMHRRGA